MNFMMSLSGDKHADIIDAFNTTSRYLDDILNIYNVYFDNNMVSQIYPSELQLNKANTLDTEAAFLDLHLSISNDIVFIPKFMINVTILILKLPNSHFKMVTRYHKLRKHFLNFIDDTLIWYLNSKLGLNLSCAKDFRNLNSMVTW